MSKAARTSLRSLVHRLSVKPGSPKFATSSRINFYENVTSVNSDSLPLPVPCISNPANSSSSSTSSSSKSNPNPIWLQYPASSSSAGPLSYNNTGLSSVTPPSSSPSINNIANPASARVPQAASHLHNNNLVLLHGAYGIPKRPRSAKGKERETIEADSAEGLQEQLQSVQVGEDAYFVSRNSLGVADGVGGWSGRKGADPGLFAARLMHHCATEFATYGVPASSSPLGTSPSGKLSFVTLASSQGTYTPSPSIEDTPSIAPHTEGQLDPARGDPVEVLHKAWDATLTEFFDLELNGSSTALVALLQNDELRIANLGDCCCSIIRAKEYIFRSPEQQHSFNYPFQLGTNSQDTPRKDGQSFNIKVQKNDIVILSSDGLVDNLFDEDILEEVLRYPNPQELSQALCSRAKAVSEDQRAVTSPFQQRANEEGIHFVGGKHDDISVLVAIIGEGEDDTVGL